MSRRLPARRRRNPDEDVLFPYAERFSSETFPSLTYPDYSTTLVQRRGATARAPSQVDGNLVFDAFFGEGMFEDFLTNPRRRKFEEEDGSVFLLARSSAHFSDRAHERLKRYHVAAMVESRKNLRPLQNALKAYGEWVIEGNEAVSRYSMSLSEAENLAKSVAAGLGLSLHEVGGKITRFQTSEKPGRVKPYPAEEYMDNPRRRNGVAEYQRRLAKQAAAAKQMKKISSKKRGGPLLRQVAVSEREDGFHVVLLFRDPTSAMDGETELQMHADWVRDFNEIETEHPMSRAEAMRLANEVAAEYRYGRAGKIVVYPLRRSKAKKVSSLKRRPAAGARVTYAAEEYMDNPAKKAPAAKKKAPAAKKKAPAKRRAPAASSAPVAPAMAEVMHEDGGYEVVTAKGKKFSWDDLRDIIGCELLEFVPLGGGRVMAVNEEGRMHGAGINSGASLLVRTAIFGPAVVLARSALK
jgi:hypothetical protein